MDAAHQTTALAVEVRVDFFLEGGLVEIAGADGDAESDGFFQGFASHVLENGEGGVDSSAFAEEGADGAAGAFRGDEDDIDVGRDVDFG